jgi:hypothetical protein
MPTRLILFALAAVIASYGQAPVMGNCTVFPADNIWNTPVDTAAVSPASSTYVTTIGATLGMHADFGSGTWDGGPIGIPFLTVPGTQPKYPVSFLYSDESDPGPYAVPLTAPIEGGSNSTGDRHAIAVDTSNCVLYELYRAFPGSGMWSADSGAIFDLKSNALRPQTWTADAAGLPIMPGLVRYDEVASGEIRHALRFTVPQTQRAYIWPARHYASSLTDPKYPPMGQRFRLKASLDVSAYPADVQVILRALKKYGMIIADNGSAWYLSGQPDERWNNSNLSQLRNVTGSMFEAVDTSSLMIDVNSGQARQAGAAVVVTPASATVQTQANQQFTAEVQNSTDQAVSWAVNGLPGGNSEVGYIDPNGLYSAPSAVPAGSTVNVQATTVKTPPVTGSATVAIRYPAPVISSVTPNPVQTGSIKLTIGGNAFRSGAMVKLDGASLVTTYVSSSQLTASGSTTAAGSSVPVSVTNPDGQVSTAFQITVTGSSPVSVVVSPKSASVRLRRNVQFYATVQNTTDLRVTWRVNGVQGGNSTVGVISSGGLYTAPNSLPSPSSVTVSAVSAFDSTKSGSATVSIRR